MSENFFILILLLSPAAFTLTAIASWFQRGLKPNLIKQMSIFSALLSIILVAWSGLFVSEHGLSESGLIGINEFGISVRLDSVSVIMLSLIALLGFIIIKFSNNYLDGDSRQGAFMGRLAATIASVQLLVLAGNLGLLLLAWILTSISLHRLLVFYHDRPGAQIAAKKKFILARLGDLCLLTAIVLLYWQFGSGNLEVIFNSIQSRQLSDLPFMSAEGPALFLALAALLKSAQFPTHGWLIEVMETPTPVSALLHAGLLNAGPFLIIRMAYVMDMSTIAPVLLISIGGFTALFGSVVYLTQTSIKTALGYSSVAHMGFSLMVCGLGVYAAAMLHLVAHSFYKAHAFLSSGSVIDRIRGSKIVNPARASNPWKVAAGMVAAMVLFIAFAWMWGLEFQNKDIPLLIIGSVFVMGLASIFTRATDSAGGMKIMLTGMLMALLVVSAFFTLESGMHYLLSAELPAMATPGTGKLVAAVVIVTAFAITVLLQILAPWLSGRDHFRTLAIHVRNGFYANAIFDRLVGALRIQPVKSAQAGTYQRLPQSEPTTEFVHALDDQVA